MLLKCYRLISFTFMICCGISQTNMQVIVSVVSNVLIMLAVNLCIVQDKKGILDIDYYHKCISVIFLVYFDDYEGSTTG